MTLTNFVSFSFNLSPLTGFSRVHGPRLKREMRPTLHVLLSVAKQSEDVHLGTGNRKYFVK